MKRAAVTVLALGALACGGAVSSGSDDGGTSSSGGGGSSGSSGGSSSGGSTSGGSSSGGSSNGGSTSGGSSNGGSTSGSGSGRSPCPSSPPAQGAACAPSCDPSTTPTCLTCEWGTSVDPSCNDEATCTNGGWQLRGHTPGDCRPGTPGGVCPSSFAAVPRMTSCSPYGAICDYSQGRCACSVPAGPFPVDASAAAVWLCEDPMSGCPAPRPLYGSPCTQEGQRCDYGACDIPGGTAEVCAGGVWDEALVACPAAALRP